MFNLNFIYTTNQVYKYILNDLNYAIRIVLDFNIKVTIEYGVTVKNMRLNVDDS